MIENDTKPSTQKGSFKEIFKAPQASTTWTLTSIFFLLFLGLQGIIMFMPKIISIENRTDKYILLTFQQICGLPGKFLGAELIDTQLGRKYTNIIGLVAIAITSVLFSFASTFYELVIASFFFANAVSISVAGLYAITPESFPASNRSMGFGFMMGVARIGAMFSSMITGRMLDNYGIFYTLIYSSFLFFMASIIGLSLKETRGETKIHNK